MFLLKTTTPPVCLVVRAWACILSGLRIAPLLVAYLARLKLPLVGMEFPGG
jgi:hypothetical protein